MGSPNRGRPQKTSGKRLGWILVSAIEFLISQGHSFGSIKKYSIPQLFLFMSLIAERNKALEEDHGNKDKGRKVKTSYRDG